jgi:glycosyltransferase involved in cell wall biosynthesis
MPYQAPLYPKGIQGRVARTGHRITRRMGLNDLLPFEFFTTLCSVVDNFDIIHFHDLNSAISPKTLELCARKRPVVFTAHDCSCFTGGCIYPLRCERFLKTCGHCPQLASLGARFDFTKTNIGINRRIAKNKAIQFVFPSNWLHEKASLSLQFARKAETIPNGFSPLEYEFRPRNESRQKLGIREDRKVVVVAAHYLADPRKGIEFALAAIRAIADLNPLVIFVGHPPSDIEARIPGIQYWLSGFVYEKQKLGLLLGASDVFLFPSLEDNLPIMVQEAMAAGTPVVAFSVGGIPEMVVDRRTGWLCTVGDQSGLNQCLREALLCNDRSRMTREAQAVVRERYSIDTFGIRHLELYNRLSR